MLYYAEGLCANQSPCWGICNVSSCRWDSFPCRCPSLLKSGTASPFPETACDCTDILNSKRLYTPKCPVRQEEAQPTNKVIQRLTLPFPVSMKEILWENTDLQALSKPGEQCSFLRHLIMNLFLGITWHGEACLYFPHEIKWFLLITSGRNLFFLH